MHYRACRHLNFLLLTGLIATLTACNRAPSESPAPQPGVTAAAADTRPNLLLIVADDLGYTDLGVFGSEISTPNIDRLAKSGLVLTNYYTTPLCAPTRSELLSGTDHHRAGEGMMQVQIEGAPGYEGFLNHRVVSLATRLKDAGYHTYMAGKWHLGFGDDQSPHARGFERTFALLDGGASHFGDQIGVLTGTKARYREDGQPVTQLPADFYSTDFYTDKLIGYLEAQKGDGKPFFAYLAYTAPHWPIQAPDADIARQRGRYDEGFEVLRQRRFEAWKVAGMAPADAELPRLPRNYVPWASLTDEEKAVSVRTMETYAAMIEHMDGQIGRLLDYLKSTGRLANTLIVFQSDNGAEGMAGSPEFGGGADNGLDKIGRPGSFAFIGPGWAEASSAPFYLTKAYTAEGGIHVPAIINGPKLGVPTGRNDALIITYDVAPTFLELARADPALYADREDVLPITGRSFAGLLRGDYAGRGESDVVGREHAGNGAIRRGDWKLLWVSDSGFYQGEAPPGGGPPPMSGLPMPRARFDHGTPAGTPIGPGGPWQLFNLKSDPAEHNDLTASQPQIAAELLREWDRYVTDDGVIVKSGGANQRKD
jgi:arylsulfatase